MCTIEIAQCACTAQYYGGTCDWCRAFGAYCVK